MYMYPSQLQHGDIINNVKTIQGKSFLNYGNERKIVKCVSTNHFNTLITFTDNTIAAADSISTIKIVRA